ncbi:unnamed protein product [Hymenolepis diminuta]|uniref:Uncharacterized protein n=1 Tax=Hymenolepis diminuta TaxID=6216 RepID=A0A564YDK3_HYMDI|nr:unnamed protein product [Hymenolepis diminuta]
MGNCCMPAFRAKGLRKSVEFNNREPQYVNAAINITTQPNCTTEHVYYAPSYALSSVQKSCFSARPPLSTNLEEIQHIADRELDNEESDPSINIKCDPVFVLVKNRMCYVLFSILH